MKIAITGANGFVGSYLVKFFAKNSENTIFALNRNVQKIDKNIEFIAWDLEKEVEKIFWCDIFIHSAAITSYEISKKKILEKTQKMNENILQFVKKSGCKHFVLISSSSVYQGKNGILKTSEKIEEKNLKNSYSLSKYISEKFFIENLPKNIKISILRPRAVYGEWDRVLVPNILKNQIFGRLILPGNGKNKTSITEINHFVNTINNVIIEEKVGIFNDFSEVETYENLYKKILKENNLNGIIFVPIWIFRILKIFRPNKYSYIIDTFWWDKILEKSDFF